MLDGRSSKCSSRGSDSHTRTGRAIFALRLLHLIGYSLARASGMVVFATSPDQDDIEG